MQNPFKYGETVAGSFFTDRKKEKEELIREIKSTTNVFLYSPRRYGKSSLILEVLKKVRRENIVGIYVDLLKATTRQKFYELYAKEIARSSTGKIEEALNYCKKLFSHFIPRIVLKDGNLPDIEFEVGWSKENETSIGEEILETPQKIARSKKRKVVVVFDEFTEIARYDGRTFEGFLRSFIQHHHDVSYIFTASKTRLLLEMTGSPKRPFYHSGRLMRLDKIPEDEFKKFVKKGFNSIRIQIGDTLLERIFTITQNHPYYTQMFCHELWNRVQARKNISRSDIELTLTDIIHHQSDYFLARWEGLSDNQRSFLLAIASSGGENVFSSDFIRRNNLGSASTVQRSAKRLIELEILEKMNNKFEISDIFFELWLKRKMM